MGCEDSVLDSKERKCNSCGANYVSWQQMCADDSHYVFDQEYLCPLCNYSQEQKEEFAKKRNDCFRIAELPQKNLDLILNELMEKYKKIPSPTGCNEDDWKLHLPAKFKNIAIKI